MFFKYSFEPCKNLCKVENRFLQLVWQLARNCHCNLDFFSDQGSETAWQNFFGVEGNMHSLDLFWLIKC